MHKFACTWIDFNGKPHNEDIYFHLMVPEIADLQFNPMVGSDFSEFIKEGMRTGDGAKIYTIFKLLVINSYGRRSDDGEEFHKKPEWTEQFLNSPRWEQFFLYLTDPKDSAKNGAAFFNDIFPEYLMKQVEELEGINKQTGGPKAKTLDEMNAAELKALVEEQSKRLENTGY